jgi:hypothetical protein
LIHRAIESDLDLTLYLARFLRAGGDAATQTQQEFNMRSFLVIAFAVSAFVATMTVEITSANAVVCAAGVVRAGCAGPSGAAVVVKPPPAAACRYVVVNGVRVRQCV